MQKLQQRFVQNCTHGRRIHSFQPHCCTCSTDGFGVRLLFSSTYHDRTIVSSSFKTLYRTCSLYKELVLQLQSRSPLVQIPATQNILLPFNKTTSLSDMGQEKLQLRKMLIREWFLGKNFCSKLNSYGDITYFICIFSIKYVFP